MLLEDKCGGSLNRTITQKCKSSKIFESIFTSVSTKLSLAHERTPLLYKAIFSL
jgi:hypothetical protein